MDMTKASKLDFLDGMRSLAMLNVLFFHALTLPSFMPTNRGIALVERILPHGQTGVVVFIVLSGYCLMLPVARSPAGTLRGGNLDFLKRRAFRILPAYYFVLLICMALAYGITVLNAGTTNSLTPRHIVSHLLLIQNLSFDTAFSLNGTMWSVATEWQIYFVFVLLLLPLWRRFGILATTVIAYTIGILPQLLLPESQNFYWARPWYLGMFAIGMLAACADFRPFNRDLAPFHRFTTHLPIITGFLITSVLIVHAVYGLRPCWQIDTLIALCTVFVISSCVRSASDKPADDVFNRIRRGLSHPVALTIAGFSYTAYLIQHIVFKFCTLASGFLHLHSMGFIGMNILFGIPATLFVAFYLAKYIERPFLSRSTKKQTNDSPLSIPEVVMAPFTGISNPSHID